VYAVRGHSCGEGGNLEALVVFRRRVSPSSHPRKTCRVQTSVETSSAEREALRKGRAVAGLSVSVLLVELSTPLSLPTALSVLQHPGS